MMAADKEFAYQYSHAGTNWIVTVFAEDREDADAKIKRISGATYIGEVFAKVPAIPGAGWLARMWCRFKNSQSRK